MSIDLHGDADKRETDEFGNIDENVFEIKKGVVVSLLIRQTNSERLALASRFDLQGSAFGKFAWLNSNSVGTTAFEKLNPRPEKYVFIALDHDIGVEYEDAIPVPNFLQVNSTGFESGRDEILTDFSSQELFKKLKFFATGASEVIQEIYSVDKAWGKRLFDDRKSIVEEKNFARHITPFLFAPFDVRYCFFRKNLLKTNSYSAGKHLIGDPTKSNIALMVMRQVSVNGDFSHVAVTRIIPNNRSFYSTKGKVSYFPLWLYSDTKNLIDRIGHRIGPNINPQVLTQFDGLGLNSAEEILYYVYAIFYSCNYRIRYAEFLKLDFPRFPLTSNLELFRTLTKLGSELVALHLVEFALEDEVDAPADWPRYPRLAQFSGGSRVAEKFPAANKAWQDGRVAINSSSGFTGVPEEVWNFQIGGYQVCHKWLKDRNGRTLSDADILHYCKIVTALHETIRLMAEIDEVIEEHGGWPIQ